MTDPYRGPQSSSGFELNQPTIISLLYLASFITGITGIVGVVLAYVWGGQPKANWETSHYAYHIRTFWFGLIGFVVGAILSLILIGFLVMLATGVWVAVRSVMSLLNAQKRLPMPNPQTLLF
ncbi:hypothetical protein NX02_28565 [Sphingomonas sanxanigenens DSM 19645 = NX02]|uniref:DUF4870 domain-containing protein n=2 Tax=Sphingomonas sanxanigenens TaxID=397260 RepID=W0AL26_9SPHN|nr:hypothetical protein NX02_28565 [Sphingomonas sanxanigenens DSM 19645 = NX02]